MGMQVAQWRQRKREPAWRRRARWIGWFALFAWWGFLTNPNCPINGNLRALFAVAPALLTVYGNAYSRAGRRLAVSHDADERFWVQISILRNNQKIGTDDGVLWFADGLLRFRGMRTEFAIPPSAMCPNRDPSEAFPCRYEFYMRVGEEERRVMLHIDLRRRYPGNCPVGTWSFDGKVKRWAETESCNEAGAVLPQMDLSPEVAPKRDGSAMMVLASVGSAFAVCAVTEWILDRRFSVAALRLPLFFAGIAGFVGALALVITAWEARRLRRIFPDDPAFAATPKS